VVDVMVSDETLSAGVSAAWLLLAALALALIAAAVWVADWMGRGLVTSIEDLARSAHDLAGGDLGARVEPQDPPELREVGEAFNYLAGRLNELLIEERESVADLSHRLRTPLTSVKLQAESLADPNARRQMLTQVERLEQAMNQVIELARSPAARPLGSCVLDEVVGRRARFWGVLTDDQGRELTVRPGAGQGRVLLDADAIEVILDALIGNVLTHTPPGTRIDITTGIRDGALWLEVADDGPGFGDIDALQRGFSGAGSTGLGLDIVRKGAEAVGGRVEIGNRPAGGGAVVSVVFG
jgi:signal transduction histidine kinase